MKTQTKPVRPTNAPEFLYKVAFALLRLKKAHPFLYKTLDFVTSGMVLGTIILTSVGIALYAAANGYCSFDSAMIGVCVFDFNVTMIWLMRDPMPIKPDDEE